MQKIYSNVVIPNDLVLVGYISGAYGLQGWLRIKPFADDPEALLTAKTWWFDKPELHDVDRLQAKMHSGDVVAQVMGVVGREAAESLRGTAVHISRAHFPALAKGEFYWVDLIGLTVDNLRGEMLGQVIDMMDNGAHPILRVGPVVNDENDGATLQQSSECRQAQASKVGHESLPVMLIPFVDQFVKTIDQAAGKIIVDWERDY